MLFPIEHFNYTIRDMLPTYSVFLYSRTTIVLLLISNRTKPIFSIFAKISAIFSYRLTSKVICKSFNEAFEKNTSTSYQRANLSMIDSSDASEKLNTPDVQRTKSPATTFRIVKRSPSITTCSSGSITRLSSPRVTCTFPRTSVVVIVSSPG